MMSTIWKQKQVYSYDSVLRGLAGFEEIKGEEAWDEGELLMRRWEEIQKESAGQEGERNQKRLRQEGAGTSCERRKKAVKVREVNWIQGGCNTMEGSNFLIRPYIFFYFFISFHVLIYLFLY